jgi:hypothetical protein
MSQEYEAIGTPTQAVDAVAARHEGSPLDVPEELGAQATDHDLSFFARRANTQVLNQSVPTMAGHEEQSMAERSIQPY